MIWENIKKIEIQINKENIKENYDIKFYEYCDVYEYEIKTLYENFKNNEKDLKKFFLDEENYLKGFNLKFNDLIKNEFDYLSIIIATLVLKSFTDIQNINYDDDKKFYNNSFESDSIINKVIYNFDSFKTWLEMSYNINLINKKYLVSKKIRHGIFKYIHTLSEEKIISIVTNWVGKKSINFYIINIKRKNFINLELYTEKFKLYQNKKNIYIYINHHTNMFKILKENIHSGKTIDINSNSKFFENILKIHSFIDYDLLEYYFNNKLKILNYKKENLHNNYNTIIEEIKKSIKLDDKNSIKIFSSKASVLLDLIRIFEILKNRKNAPYYFPITLCFRGRTYFTSSISFTFHKEIRYCLHQGEYNINEEPNFHPLNYEVNNIIDKYIYKIEELKNYNFKNQSKHVLRSIIWIMISISEIEKKNLGSKVSISNFLDNAINIINSNKTIYKMDEYDDLKLKSLIKTLNEIDKGVHIKRLISKDATASVFQHLIKTLGNNTEDSLMWCNLKSKEYWYDTYEYILEKWKEKQIKEENEKTIINKYFTRKSIKKTIMTFQYGSKKNTCWKYFKEVIEIEEKQEEKIKKYFDDFYIFLNDNIGILKNNPEEIIEKLKKTSYIINLKDGVNVDLNYFKIKKGQLKILVKGKRKTKLDMKLLNEIDYKKIKSSSRANYIHTLDSAIIRYVISIIALLTIHDCFLIDPRNVSFLISLVNDAMRKSFHDLKINKNFKIDEIFSIFIII